MPIPDSARLNWRTRLSRAQQEQIDFSLTMIGLAPKESFESASSNFLTCLVGRLADILDEYEKAEIAQSKAPSINVTVNVDEAQIRAMLRSELQRLIERL